MPNKCFYEFYKNFCRTKVLMNSIGIRIMNDLDYINELKELELRVYDLWNKVKTKINDEFDARISTFHLLAVAIRSFKIYLILKKENLDGNEWYNRIYQSGYNQPWPPTNG
jgi:hypothetical protein